ADGRTYPAGSLVIHRAQPYGTHVKDLFDVQRYPAGDPPYDVAGWTLPYLLGVRRVEVMGPLADGAQLRLIEQANEFSPSRTFSSRDSDSWRQVFQLLKDGQG